MKKLILIIIALSFLCGASVNAYEQSEYTTDSEAYNISLSYDKGTGLHYSTYYYNDKFYNIIMPSNLYEFNYLDGLYRAGKLSKKNIYYRTIKLNYLLIDLRLEPLVY